MVRNKRNFRAADYSTCVVHTKTIIHLSVSVKVVDIYLVASQIGKYQPLSDLHFDEYMLMRHQESYSFAALTRCCCFVCILFCSFILLATRK